MGPIDTVNKDGFLTTSVDSILKWGLTNSLWPFPLGISCCAIEMMAFASSRTDAARFGAEVFRMTPRQSDLLLVAGTVTYKMANVVRNIYDLMPEPKWVVAMGACASTGGMFRSYSVVQGVDKFLPVDAYVAGCPPRPEALVKMLLDMRAKINKDFKPSLLAIDKSEN